MQCMAQILEDFNTKGIFPSDEKMAEALGVKPTDSKVFDLELDLINMAQDNPNHPYHPMVNPNCYLGSYLFSLN
jgi:hypothetical protein